MATVVTSIEATVEATLVATVAQVRDSASVVRPRAGMGGYRLTRENPEHALAVRRALELGVELFDTAAYYTDGESERLLGRELNAAFSSGIRTRQSVTVVTQVGYVQDSQLKRVKAQQDAGSSWPEMSVLSKECWYCIHPRWLEDQISGSLERLGLDFIDVLLIQNPDDADKYSEQMRKAFQHLESEVNQGRIRSYGVSSSSYLALDMLWNLAVEVGGEAHHFTTVQFPFNLYEPEAVLESSQAEGATMAERAARLGLHTLVNRPLNAFRKSPNSPGGLVRLADFRLAELAEDLVARLEQELSATIELETRFPVADAGPHFKRSWVAWGHLIQKNAPKFHDVLWWKDFYDWRMGPELRLAAQHLARAGDNSLLGNWWSSYQGQVARLVEAMTDYLSQPRARPMRALTQRLEATAPALLTSFTLPRKLLRIYTSFPGVGTVLVGTRTVQQVQDIWGEDGKRAEREGALSPLLALQCLEVAEKLALEDERVAGLS